MPPRIPTYMLQSIPNLNVRRPAKLTLADYNIKIDEENRDSEHRWNRQQDVAAATAKGDTYIKQHGNDKDVIQYKDSVYNAKQPSVFVTYGNKSTPADNKKF